MLTSNQLTTLRAAVLADQTASTFFAEPGDAAGLQRYLNGASAFVVWRASVTQDEIMQNGFDWTRVDNLSVGPARIWEWMFNNETRTIDPRKANVRAGIEAVWKGTQADLAVRATVYAHCKRPATVAERMLAAGVGTDANPGLATFEGDISALDAAMLIYKDDGTIWRA
jgi:hypothetical protein